MKIKSSVFGAGLGIAALLLTACGANNDPSGVLGRTVGRCVEPGG